MLPIVHNSIAILNICIVDYWCIINEISKNKAVNLLQDADLRKNVEYDKIQESFHNV